MLDKILDRAASIAIIIASIVFVGVVTYKYLIADKRPSTLHDRVPIGKKLDLPDLNWEGNGHTVVIALQKGCPFCNESAPFYQRLHREVSGKQNISIAAVFPEPVENGREHLKALEVPFDEIRESSLKSIGVSVTPTLLVVDKTGTVINGWIGKLSSERENEVLATLARLSQTQGKTGNLSPRTSSEYVVNNKRIRVDYGSPSLRGREVIGKLVPYDKVWGTGADKGTVFSTETDLVINDKVVPKGSYTLLTLPSKDSDWKLIINKSLDIWCTTPYDSVVQASELLRVDMKKEAIDTPVEQLQYSFSPSDSGVTMKIQWGKTSVYVDIKAKDIAKSILTTVPRGRADSPLAKRELDR